MMLHTIVESGSVYPIVNHIPRSVDSMQNHTQGFGLQWNKSQKYK